jgi:hypothetical protein
LSLGGVVVANATTGADGRYAIGNQVPSAGYSIRFKNPGGQIVATTPYNQSATTALGNPSTGTTTLASGTATQSSIGDSISNVTLYAGDNVVDQNLPIDPSGIVYDSVTRAGIAGAVVTLIGPDGNPVSGNQVVQGASTITTDASGLYQFDLTILAPNGNYKLQITPPSGYVATPAVLDQPTPRQPAPPWLPYSPRLRSRQKQ